MAKTKHRKDKHKNKKPKLASKADKYEMYQAAVQAPDVDVEFFARVYREVYKGVAKRLREDFCGTFAVCCEWVKSHSERRAIGVDLDPEPLDWGRAHNMAPLAPAEKKRIELLETDVLAATTGKVDIVAAQNFSYCIFKTREELRRYFEVARAALDEKGVLICDLFGGYESMEDDREELTEYDGFDYVWDQHTFDPVTHFGTYRIHFRFKDRSEMTNAFVYDWRLWSIPEVRELMLEAGFEDAFVYWEETDEESGEGNGNYVRTEKGECDPAWNAYIVGVK
ncbi:MAG: class I SAM-dependent methyltransferase [Myxococcota bacterium]